MSNSKGVVFTPCMDNRMCTGPEICTFGLIRRIRKSSGLVAYQPLSDWKFCLQVTKSSHLLGDEVFLCIMVCAVMTPLHLQRGPIITSAVDPSSLITLFHPCSTSRLNISDPGQLPLDHQCLCVLPLYTHSLGSTMVWVSKIFFQC